MNIDERKQEIFNLCIDFIRSFKKQEIKRHNDIKAQLTAKLFAAGITREIIYRIIMNLQNIGTKKNLYKFLSKYHLLEEEVKNKIYRYFVKISLLYSTKQSFKSDISAMKSYFADKDVQIIKYKIENNTISVGEEIPPNKILDVDIKMIIKTTNNRHTLLQCIEPNYLLIKLKEIREEKE